MDRDNSLHYHHHDINSSPRYNTLPPIFPHNNTTSANDSNTPSIIADTFHSLPNPLHYHPDSPQPWNTHQHHLHSDEAEHLIQTLPPLHSLTHLTTTPSTSDPSAYHHQSTSTLTPLQHTPSPYNRCTRNTQPTHLHRSFIHQPRQDQSMTETNSYWRSPYTHSPFNYAQASRSSRNSISTTNITRNHQSPSPTLFLTPDATLSTSMPQLHSQQSIIDLISDDDSQNPPSNRHTASKRPRTPNSNNPSKKQKLSADIGVLDLSDINTDKDYAAKQAAEKEAAQKDKALKESEKPIKLTTMDCIICLDTPTDLTVTWCGHLFCSHCLHEALLADPRKKCCPICRQSISTALKPAANKTGTKLPKNGVYPLSMKLMTAKRKGKLVDDGTNDEPPKDETQAEKGAREEYKRFSNGAAAHWNRRKSTKEAEEAKEADERLQASANGGGSNVAVNANTAAEAEILQDFDFDGFLADSPGDEWL